MNQQNQKFMRIVQITSGDGYGGTEVHTLQMASELIKAGHEVIIVVRPGSWIEQECKAAGLPYKSIRLHGTCDFLAVLRLRLLIWKWGVDIVHGHLFRAAHYAAMACKHTRAISISTCHSTCFHKHLYSSRKIIAVSNAVRETLINHGCPEEQIKVILNGVPQAQKIDRHLLRSELGIPSDVFAAVCVGRMDIEKGQKDLIETIPTLRENVHLYFIGDTNTEYGQEMLNLSQRHPRIHFMGFRSDVSRVLSAFDLCVAPTYRDAMPLTLLEASQAGLPIVANRVGGIPEIVEENRSGILTTPSRIDELAEAINRIAGDPAMCKHFGKRASEIYQEKFTLNRMVDSTLTLYGEILGCPGLRNRNACLAS